MRADDLKPCILRSELLSDRKRNDCGKVPCKVVLMSCLQFPILDLLQLLVAVLIEVLGEPLNGMIGGDCMVDKLQKAMCEVPTSGD